MRAELGSLLLKVTIVTCYSLFSLEVCMHVASYIHITFEKSNLLYCLATFKLLCILRTK